MGFKDYLSIISRRWQVFVPIVGLVIGGHFLWVAYGQPQLFRASAMVVLNPPLTGMAFPFVRPITPVNRLETFREPPVLKNAFALLTGRLPFNSKAFEEPPRREAIRRFTEELGAETTGTDGKWLLQEIESALNVTMGKDERVITVEASSPAPDRALAFSWSVAEGARVFHNDRCRETVEKTVAELMAQRTLYEKERELALREKTEFQKRTGFTNFPRYQEMVQGIILGIDGDLSQLEGQQREIERNIDERISRSQQGGDEVQAVAAELGESLRLRNLQNELLRLRLEHDIATSRLTDRHPSISDMKAKIERLEYLISEEQETIVSDGLKKWSAAIRDLVKQSAGIALKLEVLRERKASLSRELFRLADVSQEYARIDERASVVAGNIDRVKGHINELEWAGLQALGQVQVHNPSDQARPVEKRGAGAGPVALMIIMAIVFALGVVYVLEYIDTRVKTEHDVRRYLGLPLLGVIPSHKNHLICDGEVKAEIAEKFHTAATLIRATARELGMKSFMVSSAVEQEGKTTVAVNLSIALAQKGARVVLVDADLRVPRIHEVLNLPNESGLTTALGNRQKRSRLTEASLSDLERPDDEDSQAALLETEVENLSVLTSGPPAVNPIQLLESERVHRLIRELGQDADFLIFDTPPLNRVGDALTIAGVVDGAIFVVGSGLCEQHEAAWAKHLLANVQANVLGVFLNRYAHRRGGGYYSYYDRSGSRVRREEQVRA